MAINAYTGLMGSGKSYEVVSGPILKAIAEGRRVVTNVDGMNNERIREYVSRTKKIDLEKCGELVHCTNEDVQSPHFFPYGKEGVNTFCYPGDLICIDEAWRFFGNGVKIHENHMIFFREHRHYVHPDTKVACDLVLMVQDISDLNRFLKSVVEVSFRTTKLKAVGRPKNYRLESFEGYRQTKQSRIVVQVKKYDPEIFPLYSSYQGGSGKENVVDDRGSIFSSKSWGILSVVILVLSGASLWYVYRFFVPDEKPATEEVAGEESSSKTSSASAVSQPVTPPPSQPDFEETDMRIVGTWKTNEGLYYLVRSASGDLQTFPASMVQRMGPVVYIMVDKQRVTPYSGLNRRSQSSLGLPPAPALD